MIWLYLFIGFIVYCVVGVGSLRLMREIIALHFTEEDEQELRNLNHRASDGYLSFSWERKNVLNDKKNGMSFEIEVDFASLIWPIGFPLFLFVLFVNWLDVPHLCTPTIAEKKRKRRIDAEKSLKELQKIAAREGWNTQDLTL